MQPQNVNAHQRVKYEPTRIKRGRSCRLFGVDFHSVDSCFFNNEAKYNNKGKSLTPRSTQPVHYLHNPVVV